MKLNIIDNEKFLTPVLLSYQPERQKVERFRTCLQEYFQNVNEHSSEAATKIHFRDLLKSMYSPHHNMEPHDSIDFVIRSGGKDSNPSVLFETKKSDTGSGMILDNNVNRKALHELVLYYMQERFNDNGDIRRLVIKSAFNIYIFDAAEFNNHFYENTNFRNDFSQWTLKQKSSDKREFFYTQIAKKYVDESDAVINATHIDLLKYKDVLNNGDLNEIVLLYKLLSPFNLLKHAIRNDSNKLNRVFYEELLHIIGLKESENGAKRTIARLAKPNRNLGSLIENTIAQIRDRREFNAPHLIEKYGDSEEEREFNIGLELCLTWINRILFLKLLEAQLLKFNKGDDSYKFLNDDMIKDFNDLRILFFMVLAVSPEKRSSTYRHKFASIPYLNSSLFEPTELENLFEISILDHKIELPLLKKTVLKDQTSHRAAGQRKPLTYLLDFLDAYDFGASENGELRDESKTIINASVLGLIFEKINGYRDGAIFTPGYITMYMSRTVIEKTVIEKFQKSFPDWKLNSIIDLKNHLTDKSTNSIRKYNEVIDGLRICDPAVGSGHFLVSCLNELIALKSRLGILADKQGEILTDYVVEVENDELLILHSTTNEMFSYHATDSGVPKRLQIVQETIFDEKRKLIENCLFGVDINSNSVSICRLRLWIELLKSSYYRNGVVGDLETLPSIDINIKCGNSLLSRFPFNVSLRSALRGSGLSVKEYKSLVREYKQTNDLQKKSGIQDKITKIREIFYKSNLTQLEKKNDFELGALREIEGQDSFSVLKDDLNKSKAKRLEDVRKEIKKLEMRRESLMKHKVFMEAFEWRYEFPEVLDNKGEFEGFDIIITNPPYMRVQEIEKTQPEQKDYYKQNFPKTAVKAYELANLFFELTLTLSKKDGNNIFILPHKFFNSDNGESLRNYLLNSKAIKEVTHFGANQIFDNATTYSCIVLFNNQESESFKFKYFGLNDDVQNEMMNRPAYSDIQYNDIESTFTHYGKNSWILFEDPIEYNLFKKCYRSNYRISDAFANVYQGIATSRDNLYICKKLDETKEEFRILVNPDNKDENPPIETKEFLVEKEFFKPFLIGDDVRRYASCATDKLVFFPYMLNNDAELVSEEILSQKYPLTFKFVQHYAKVFKSRERNKVANQRGWYGYIYPKNLTLYEREKLLTMQICTYHPNVTLDTNSVYHNTMAQGLILNDKVQQDYRFFLGILNSKLFWWFIKHTADTLSGDARRLYKTYIDPFPLPKDISPKVERKIVDLVKELLEMCANDGSADEIESLESQINSAVYAMYDLDSSEIQRIENFCQRSKFGKLEKSRVVDN